MKHGEGLAKAVAAFWAEQMATLLAPLGPDLVLAVPLTLVEPLQARLQPEAPCCAGLGGPAPHSLPAEPIAAWRRTDDQKNLVGERRWENVKGAFRVPRGPTSPTRRSFSWTTS